MRETTFEETSVISTLLSNGLGESVASYQSMFQVLKQRRAPESFPKFGYVLESDGRIAGSITLIFSEIRTGGHEIVRCHVTGWYVLPEFRSHANLFAARAVKRKDVTYINLSARPATTPIIQAHGFAKYSEGQFLAVPLLSAPGKERGVKVLDAASVPGSGLNSYDAEVLIEHRRHGCIAFFCAATDGFYPFVFQPRKIRGVPGARLIYCRDLNDVPRFAASIGLELARRGRFLVSMDANGKVPGLAGKYFAGLHPRWYKGVKPRLGDLAYTLPAIFPTYG